MNELFARSFERARRGRRLARVMVVTAIVPFVIAGFFIAVAPPAMGGGPSPAAAAPGILGAVIGFVWLLRTYRAAMSVEPGRGPFRYRSPRG